MSEAVLFPDPTLSLSEQPDSVIMALTLYGEARGERQEGQVAVAHVILNRRNRAHAFVIARGKRHPLFGDGSVADVCLRPWQFSCWNKGDPNRERLVQAWNTGGASVPVTKWVQLWTVAQDALDGNTEDPTKGATHYCTHGLWGSTENPGAWYSAESIAKGITHKTVAIDGHVFGRTA